MSWQEKTDPKSSAMLLTLIVIPELSTLMRGHLKA